MNKRRIQSDASWKAWARGQIRQKEVKQGVQATLTEGFQSHETSGSNSQLVGLIGTPTNHLLHMGKELRVGDKRVDISGPIVFVGEPATGKGGKRIRVGVKDSKYDTVFFTLFGDNAELALEKGKTLSVQNGYVTEYPEGSGKPQFNVGRYGTASVE